MRLAAKPRFMFIKTDKLEMRIMRRAAIPIDSQRNESSMVTLKAAFAFLGHRAALRNIFYCGGASYAAY